METNFNSERDREDLREQLNSGEVENEQNSATELNASANEETDMHREKHRHHEDHHVNRKYRVYTNHSSANDQPRTNTSF